MSQLVIDPLISIGPKNKSTFESVKRNTFERTHVFLIASFTMIVEKPWFLWRYAAYSENKPRQPIKSQYIITWFKIRSGKSGFCFFNTFSTGGI